MIKMGLQLEFEHRIRGFGNGGNPISYLELSLKMALNEGINKVPIVLPLFMFLRGVLPLVPNASHFKIPKL
jgi:hypothetical protein